MLWICSGDRTQTGVIYKVDHGGSAYIHTVTYTFIIYVYIQYVFWFTTEQLRNQFCNASTTSPVGRFWQISARRLHSVHSPKALEVNSPFFSTIVLFKTQLFSPGFWGFSRKRDPWKEWTCYAWQSTKPSRSFSAAHLLRCSSRGLASKTPSPGKTGAKWSRVDSGGPDPLQTHFVKTVLGCPILG